MVGISILDLTSEAPGHSAGQLVNLQDEMNHLSDECQSELMHA